MDPEEHSDTKKGKGQNQSKREFGCPCGKTYLSYPALFTHVKQKHNGKAPGKLIKPKTEKARGRPKIHIQVQEDDESEHTFNLEDQIDKILVDVQIDYDVSFNKAEGEHTCQHMATIFLEKLEHISPQGQKVLNCFLNQVKHAVDIKHGEKHWVEEKPSQIIDIANQLCHEHEANKQTFPLQKQTLISLLYILFKWMYKMKWTDHKLVKKGSRQND